MTINVLSVREQFKEPLNCALPKRRESFSLLLHTSTIAFFQSCMIGGITSSLLLMCGFSIDMVAAFVVPLCAIVCVIRVAASSGEAARNAVRPRTHWSTMNAARIVEVSNIVSVRPIDGLEDCGPGYVLSTAEGEVIAIIGQVIGEHDSEGDSLNEAMTVVIADDASIRDIACIGSRVTVNHLLPVSVDSLGIDPYIGFQVLANRTSSNTE